MYGHDKGRGPRSEKLARARRRIGNGVFVAQANASQKRGGSRSWRWRSAELFIHSGYRPCLGAAARLRRSLIASPKPSCGTFDYRDAPHPGSVQRAEMGEEV